MKRSVIAAVAAIAFFGAAVAAVPFAEAYLARGIKAEIDARGQFSAGSVDVGLFDRRITLRDVRSRTTNGLSVANWEVSGLAWPIDELLRGHSPFEGYRLGDPFRAGRVKLDGVRIALPSGQSWNIGSIELDGVDVHRFDADLPPGPFQLGALGARMFNALSLDRLEEREGVFSEPSTTTSVRFLDLMIQHFDRGKLASFSLANLAVLGAGSATDPSFAIADVKGSDLDLSRPIGALTEPSWRPGMPLGRIFVGQLAATGFTGELLQRYGLALGRIGVQTIQSGAVRQTDTRIEGFVLQPPPGVQGMQMRIVMSAMGLKELKLGLECSGAEDRDKNELRVDRCALSGPDLGEVNFSARLVDADAALWRAVDSGDPRQLYGTKLALQAASISVADKGLLDRSLGALSTANGLTKDATRANLAREIRRYQPPGVLITDDMTKLLNTVASFVEKGGTLTVDAKPDPPLELANAGLLQRTGVDFVNVLGLSARLSN